MQNESRIRHGPDLSTKAEERKRREESGANETRSEERIREEKQKR